jgi:hypothetical protein
VRARELEDAVQANASFVASGMGHDEGCRRPFVRIPHFNESADLGRFVGPHPVPSATRSCALLTNVPLVGRDPVGRNFLLGLSQR